MYLSGIVSDKDLFLGLMCNLKYQFKVTLRIRVKNATGLGQILRIFRGLCKSEPRGILKRLPTRLESFNYLQNNEH